MAKKNKNVKYIFVSGGVLSGLGKGVIAASVGLLLKSRGYKVGVLKCENYINIDSGTINPIEHGDPFLCEDGLEADMDLGTYERFLNEDMGHRNFTTMGQIYNSVITRERNFGYDGEDVEAIPHVSDEIIKRIKKAGEEKDIVVIELGGTAGEYQNMLYYEACRIMKTKMPNDVINIHATYVPIPNHLGEPKTMPTQMSVRTLMSMGIMPDFLVLRGNMEIDKRRRYLLGLKCGIEGENVIMAPDLENIYELPLLFEKQLFDTKILKKLKLNFNKLQLNKWREFNRSIKQKVNKEINICIVGKYIATGDFELLDSYASLIEAIKHASWKNKFKTNIKFVNSENIEKHGINLIPENMDGIIVPIGWGERGSEGKIMAIKHAREKKIPYLGLCFGMQLACVEFARNVLRLENANSTELNPKTQYKIIHDIPMDEKYQKIKGEGTSMRLGKFDCIVKKNTYAYSIYQKYGIGEKLSDGNLKISERHRHRYEFNNDYRKQLEYSGMIFSGTSPDDFFVEIIELPRNIHPFFIATQGHPEYKSRPLNPHPLFIEFLQSAKKFGSKQEKVFE
ncbi:MAG TPA: CTP synthase [bacterium]|nr:CTP synthase [bacterium]